MAAESLGKVLDGLRALVLIQWVLSAFGPSVCLISSRSSGRFAFALAFSRIHYSLALSQLLEPFPGG